MRKFLIIFLFLVLGIGFFSVPDANAEGCYNGPSRPIIGLADVFWGDPPGPYPNITKGPTDVVRMSLEGTFPGFGGDCQGVVVLIEIFTDGNPTNVVRTAAGGLLPGVQISGGPSGSWQWYIDWPISNRLFDGNYRFRVIALDGSPIAGNTSLNILTIVGAGPPPPPPPPPASCSVGFSPSSIISGQTTTENWTSLNDADGRLPFNCTGDLGVGITVTPSGSISVNPTSTQNCVFTAMNSAGVSSTCSATVNVTVPPPSCSVGFSPSSIITGQATTQNWSSVNDADGSLQYSCTGNLGSGNVSTPTGSVSVNPTSSQNCTFTTLNSAGVSATCSAGVTVNAAPPTANITCNGTSGSCSVGYGSSVTIDWTSTNSTSCTVSPAGWTGVSGSRSSGPLSSSQSYVVSCSGPGGTASDNVVVNVSAAPVPSCSISFSPTSVLAGQTSTETWSSVNDADGSLQYSCTGNLGSGNTTVNGSTSVSPTTTQSCTITSINIAGTAATCSATVTVNIPPPSTANINCSSCNIAYNSSDLITWSSSNTTSCTVTPLGLTGTSGGPVSTGNLTTSTVYTLDCASPGGPVSAFTVVNVNPPVIPPPPPVPPPPPPPPPPIVQSVFDGLSIPNPFSGQIRTLDDLFKIIISFLYYIAGPIVVIMIITAGLLFLFARDDSNKVQTAKRLLLYAVIGLSVILIGRGFVALLENILQLAN